MWTTLLPQVFQTILQTQQIESQSSPLSYLSVQVSLSMLTDHQQYLRHRQGKLKVTM